MLMVKTQILREQCLESKTRVQRRRQVWQLTGTHEKRVLIASRRTIRITEYDTKMMNILTLFHTCASN